MKQQLNGLQIQQACESALKLQNNLENKEKITEGQKENARRFKCLSLGCFVYALFYTFCLYRNQSGITYPFFVGGTLYFFWYYSKKCGATSAKDKKFLMIAILAVGILNFTTDSGILIFFNTVLVIVLFGVMIIESYHESTAWKIGMWWKALMHLLFGSVTQIYTPFEDGYWSWHFSDFRNKKGLITDEKKKLIMYGAIGICLSIPFLFVILILLGSADALFYDMVCNLWDALDSWSLPQFLSEGELGLKFLMIICAFIGSYAVFAYSGKRSYIQEAVKTKATQWEPLIAIAFLSMITVVYVLFSGIQIFGLFLGWMELPRGWSYAEYARQGFFQLLFVCLFNVGLVLFCTGYFRKSKVLQLLLTVISGCTYIMIASSAYRMILYISKYHLTFLRVFVLWALLVIAIVLGAVIVYIWNSEFVLFRFVLISVSVGYLCFSLMHPDYWIAKYNIYQYEQGAEMDLYYLTIDLSADASLPLYELSVSNTEIANQSRVRVTMENYQETLSYKVEDMNIRSLNISRIIAKKIWDIR